MLRAFVNCAMLLKKRLSFFYFQWKKVDQVRSEYLRSYLNWLYNWQLKSRRRSHALKGSHSMGDGRIFLKTGRDASFNKHLSNEPNFARPDPSRWTVPLKGEARRFSDKSARSQSCEIPFKLERHLLQLLAISKVVANCAHSSICIYILQLLVMALWSIFENIPNSAVNFLRPETNQNVPGCLWKLREEAFSAVVTSTNTPSFLHLNGAVNLFGAIGN